MPDEQLVDLIKRLLMLRDAKVELAEAAKRVEEQLDLVEPMVIDALTAATVSKISVDGRVVFLSRRIWANPLTEGREGLIEALRASGLGDLVTVRPDRSRLNSWVHERIEEHERETGVPVDLRDKGLLERLLGAEISNRLNVNEKASVAVRRT